MIAAARKDGGAAAEPQIRDKNDFEEGDREYCDRGKPADRVPERVVGVERQPPEEEPEEERSGVAEVDPRGGAVVAEEAKERAGDGQTENDAHPVPLQEEDSR